MGSLSQQYNAQRATREEELRRRALNSRYILIGAGAIIGAIVLVLAVSLLLPPSGKERYEADFRDLENAMLVYTSGLHAVAPPAQRPSREVAESLTSRWTGIRPLQEREWVHRPP